MTDDAKYLLDVFTRQYMLFMNDMTDKRIRRDKFDKYSYSSHAIKLLLDDIDECTSYKDVSLIRQLVRLHMEMYASFISDSTRNGKEPPLCFKCGLKSMEYFYRLTGVYKE